MLNTCHILQFFFFRHFLSGRFVSLPVDRIRKRLNFLLISSQYHNDINYNFPHLLFFLS